MGTLPAIMDIKYFHILPLKGLPLIRYKVRRIINFMKKVIKSIFHNKGLISQYINEVKKSGWRIAFDKTKNWVVKENKVDHTTQVTTPYRVVIKKEILEERKKVLHFIENFYTGGSSRLVIDLIEYFGHKYQHKIFTSAYRGEDEFLDVDVSIVDVNDTDLIQALIAQYNPDIIHVHIWEGQWYEKVFDILEGVKECKIIQNVNTPIQPIIRDNIDKYVFVSNYVLREFHKEDDKSMVIYPGSNFNMFNRELRDNYLEKDTIGMVYRLGYDKLNANSIDVFIKVVQKRPQTKVIIVGGGPRYDEYVEKVEQSGVLKNFTFTGYVPYEELPKWYRKLTIFLAPVWQESFGQVSPFAMNMGIPVAGYNVGALEEIIVNKDILAPPEDSDKLSDIVVDLLDDYDRCITIGKVNQQRASAHFAVESMVEGYEKLYDEIVSGNVSQTERL
jgi:glycosyltransferase involved in cell wall biosynthesis